MHDTLIDDLVPRAQRLGLTDPVTGFVSRDEIDTYLVQAVRFLANRYQLQHFLAINRDFLTTIAGLENYPLPSNFGFWAPHDTRRSGLAVKLPSGDPPPTNLQYYEPDRYELLRSTTPGQPFFFTFAQGMIYFMPIPDQAYTIQAIERGLDSPDVPVPTVYEEAVKIEALASMAEDQGKMTPWLMKERDEVIRTLINNEARFRQKFYTSRERIGLTRRTGRYGY